jgi:hypothetical protein
MPEFAPQKDLKRAHIFESSESKMFVDFWRRVQESVGYKIPRNTVHAPGSTRAPIFFLGTCSTDFLINVRYLVLGIPNLPVQNSFCTCGMGVAGNRLNRYK